MKWEQNCICKDHPETLFLSVTKAQPNSIFSENGMQNPVCHVHLCYVITQPFL
jgi:hypothetical protein